MIAWSGIGKAIAQNIFNLPPLFPPPTTRNLLSKPPSHSYKRVVRDKKL
ncbi:hypothetical protein B6N60_02812 [Richelia sinica FACHB-800]|uniref:Uncharacterized protein n=1 Tax=Richelia sinica FACHB-800 TaxID=1357546 RepID=A0A975T8E0_9NOST|nr:hypothetical protein B6N60_02812 [Richelia sinica FACHB-800]